MQSVQLVLLPREASVLDCSLSPRLACLFALALAVCGLLLVAGVLRLFVS